MDEIALIQQAQRGSVEAFNTLILHYQTGVYNLIYRLAGDPDAASDATQEAFISAFRHLTQYRGGSFRAWLMRIATNAYYDELRRRKRRPSVSLDHVIDDQGGQYASNEDSPETTAYHSALNEAIQACLDSLPDDQRLIAVLCDVQGYDYAEIAQIANIQLGTVKSRLSRARQKLRDCLQGAKELLPAAFRLDDERS